MRAGLITLAQQGRAPRRAIRRNAAGVWPQALRLLDRALPLRETSVLTPVGVIDQQIALARAAGLGGGEAFVCSAHGRIHGRHCRCESRICQVQSGTPALRPTLILLATKTIVAAGGPHLRPNFSRHVLARTLFRIWLEIGLDLALWHEQ
jgi:hypothetical protein